jgi:hypothetical protein
VGDVTGDGIVDIVTAPASGLLEVVEVFNGATGALETRFAPYAPGYRRGVRIAVADVTGNGILQILVQRPGNRVIDVYDGRTGQKMTTYVGVLLPKYFAGSHSAGPHARRVARLLHHRSRFRP